MPTLDGPAEDLARAAATAEFRMRLEHLTPDLPDLAVWASGYTPDGTVPVGVAERAAEIFRDLAVRARADARHNLNPQT